MSFAMTLENRMLYVYLYLAAWLKAARDWYLETFFRRKEGQTFFEYIVLVSLAIMVSAAAYALYVTIKDRFTAANTRIQSIPLE
ncbi:MAG: hypothetical protein D6796_17010 [Caldilineae bacterium]|nr:MAG: hypothetical protein D6796_17010 [Caldilineae bacterium]